jgi:hypothetical protein
MPLMIVSDDIAVTENVNGDSIPVQKKPELTPEEKFRFDQKKSIDLFLSSNENWFLFSVEIDETRLKKNLHVKDDLLIEAIGTYAQGLIYAESETEVLLTSRRDVYETLVYGQKKQTATDKLEILHSGNCLSCLQTLQLNRTLTGENVVVVIPDQNPERSDVVYLLTFKR